MERLGWGDGGYVVCCRLGHGSDASPAQISELADQLLESPAVTSVEHWLVDPAVTTITTREKALRMMADAFPDQVLVIDGSDPDAIEAALHQAPAAPAVEDAEVDVCKLVLHLAKRA